MYEEPVSYEEALGRVGYGKFHYFLILVGGFGLLSTLIPILDITYIFPSAECELSLEEKDRGLLSGAYYIGIVVSSHLLGFLSDTLGRRYILIRGLFANILIYILSSLSPNFWVLLVLRFLTGVALSGVTTCSLVYVGEFHSNKHRTQALMFAISLSSSAFIYSAGIGGWILPSEWAIPLFRGYFLSPWRVYYLFMGIPGAIVGCMVLILPESPKYLLSCGKKEEALEVMRKVYRWNTGRTKDEFTVKKLQLNPNEQVSQLTGSKISPSAVLKVIWNQTYPLFVYPHLLNMMCSCIMLFSLFFLLSGVTLWIPDLTNQLILLKDNPLSTRINFCQMVQSNWTLNAYRAGYNTSAPIEEGGLECKPVLKVSMFEFNALMGLILQISLFAVTFIMPKLNRKVVVFTTCMLTISLTLALLHVPHVYVMLLSQGFIIIVLNVVFCGISTLLVDCFPTNLRGMAVCLAIMTGRIGSACGGHTFTLFLLSHCSAMYYIGSGLIGLAAFCCIFLRTLTTPNTPAIINVTV